MGIIQYVYKGVAWTTISTVARGGASLLQMAILTRILPKSDFGVIAIAMLFIHFTQIFMDLGLSNGILHRQNIDSNEYSSLFWLNVIMGIVITSLLSLCSSFVALIYHEPQLTKLLPILSLMVLFMSFGSQHRTVQQKELKFKTIAIIDISSSMTMLVLTVVMGLLGYGIYSLAVSNLFGVIVANLSFLYIGLFKDKNVHLHLNFKETLPCLKIGLFSVGTQVMDFFSREIDTIIISTAFSKEVLGLYSLCKKLVMSLYSCITPVVLTVLTPVLSKMQSDRGRLQSIYYEVIESMTILVIPIFCLVCCFSKSILFFIYGEQYVSGWMILFLYALIFGVGTTGTTVTSLQIATGRTDSGFYWTICRIIINSVVVLVGSYYSVEFMAFLLLIVGYLQSPLAWRITIKPLIGGNFLPFFLKTFYPFLHSIVLAIPFLLLFNGTKNFFIIIGGGLTYLLLYYVTTFFMFKDSFCVSQMKEKYHSFKSIR